MKVLIFPKSTNPYLELLYSEMRSSYPGDTFAYFEATPRHMLFFPFFMLAKRLQGYRVFHMHWPLFYVSPGRAIPFSKQLSFMYSVACITSLKLLGFKVAWTVHNVVPHEQTTSSDITIARYMAKLAALKIVHSSSALTEMKALGVSTKNSTFIPHGSYVGMYPDTISRAAAREKLGIAPSECMVLFFGAIHAYKGVDELIAAYGRLPKSQQKNVRLVVVGKCTDPQLHAEIVTAAQQRGIDFHDGYVPDEDVAMYFKAADVACLPFKAITTSGSALLALSFGKPIVAPRIGALTDLPNDIGFLYDPSKKDALGQSLSAAITDVTARQKASKQAYTYAKTLAWHTIAAKTHQAFRALLAK
jgi:beta-1,4-mannosyltransferase